MKIRSPVYKMDSTEELIGMVEFGRFVEELRCTAARVEPNITVVCV